MTSGAPRRDRPLILYDVLERISRLKAERADPVEVELLAAEFRQLRAEL